MGPVQNVSVPRRPPDVEDYLEMLRRYRSWLIAPMFLGLVVAVVVGFLWPDTYVSRATLRIVPQQVPERYVQSAVSMQLAERINQMKQEILSRTGLEEIIRKPALDLYKKERDRLPMEDIVQDMRNKRIVIDAIRDSGDNSRYNSAFVVQFSYTDKYKAQAVVRELVNRFTDQNVQVQKQQASTTSDFLNNEVRLAKQKLDQAEAAITQFISNNRGTLPQQEQANAQALNMLQMQLLSSGQNMNTAAQAKTMLETQLENNRAEQKSVAANLEQYVAGSTPQSVRNEALLAAQKDLTEAQAKLASLNKMYGRNHPDVASQQEVVAALDRRRLELETAELVRPAPVQTATAPVRIVNPQAQQRLDDLKSQERILQTALAAKQSDIDSFIKEQERIKAQQSAYQQRLEQAPLNAQQYSALLNDATLKKSDYEDKIKRANMSATAQNLEDRKAGETLELLDPPSLPDHASDPQRLTWALVGTAAGLGLGVVLAAAKEVKDTSLKNLKDVRAYTNLPVLSSIALLENALLVRRKRRLGWAAWSCSVVIGCMLMATAMYYHYTSV